MSKNLDCAIVRDLLPSYVDGITSEITNHAIEEHLNDCEECSTMLRNMKEPESVKASPKVEVDYLKKVRHRSTLSSIIISITLLLLGISLLMYRFFYIGTKARATDFDFSIQVTDNNLTLNATAKSSTSAISRVVFSESAGIVNVTVYTVPKIFFNSSTYSKEYNAHETVASVRYDDLFLWWEGVAIHPTAAKLYAAVNPYIGNMPANNKIANIIGVSEQFGPYTNELQTSKEPYGWTLDLEVTIDQDDETNAKQIMATDSRLMLATIENLGYVTWKYKTDAGTQVYTVTAKDASDYVGGDIKLFSQSPADLQFILKNYSIVWSSTIY